MAIESIESRESFDIQPRSVMGIVQRRWLLALGIFALTVAGAALIAAFQRDTYAATAKLLFRIDRTSTLTGVGEGASELEPLLRTQNPLVTEIEVIKSRPMLEQTVDELTAETGTDSLSVAEVRQGLKVDILSGADILRLTYEGPDPDTAANIVNTLAGVYIENSVVASRERTTQARELLESQLPQAEAQVRESEAALRNFKEQNGVIAVNQEAQSVGQVMQDLDAQILSTQAALDEATTRSAQLRNTLGLSAEEAVLVTDLSQSPAVQGALQALQQAERDLATDRGFYTEESPVVITSRAEVDSLQNLLRQEIATVLNGRSQVPDGFLQTGQTRQTLITNFLDAEVQRLSLASRLNALYDSQASYRSRSTVLPRLEQQEAELQRRLEVVRLSYQSLLQRLQELRVAENQATENAQLIEPAIAPQNPQTGRNTTILAGGVLLGALLAATAVFLLELQDYVRSRERAQLAARPELEPR